MRKILLQKWCRRGERPELTRVKRGVFPAPHIAMVGLGSIVFVMGLLIGSVTVTLSGVVLLATVASALWELWSRRRS